MGRIELSIIMNIACSSKRSSVAAAPSMLKEEKVPASILLRCDHQTMATMSVQEIQSPPLADPAAEGAFSALEKEVGNLIKQVTDGSQLPDSFVDRANTAGADSVVNGDRNFLLSGQHAIRSCGRPAVEALKALQGQREILGSLPAGDPAYLKAGAYLQRIAAKFAEPLEMVKQRLENAGDLVTEEGRLMKGHLRDMQGQLGLVMQGLNHVLEVERPQLGGVTTEAADLGAFSDRARDAGDQSLDI